MSEREPLDDYPSMGLALVRGRLERSLGAFAWFIGTTMLGMTLLAVGELLAG